MQTQTGAAPHGAAAPIPPAGLHTGPSQGEGGGKVGPKKAGREGSRGAGRQGRASERGQGKKAKGIAPHGTPRHGSQRKEQTGSSAVA